MSTGPTQRARARRDLEAVVTEARQSPASSTAAAADVRGRDFHRPRAAGCCGRGGRPVLRVVEDLPVAVAREVRLRLRLEDGHVGPDDLDALRLQEVELPVQLVPLLFDVLQPALDLGLRARHLLLLLSPLRL